MEFAKNHPSLFRTRVTQSYNCGPDDCSVKMRTSSNQMLTSQSRDFVDSYTSRHNWLEIKVHLVEVPVFASRKCNENSACAWANYYFLILTKLSLISDWNMPQTMALSRQRNASDSNFLSSNGPSSEQNFNGSLVKSTTDFRTQSHTIKHSTATSRAIKVRTNSWCLFALCESSSKHWSVDYITQNDAQRWCIASQSRLIWCATAPRSQIRGCVSLAAVPSKFVEMGICTSLEL